MIFLSRVIREVVVTVGTNSIKIYILKAYFCIRVNIYKSNPPGDINPHLKIGIIAFRSPRHVLAHIVVGWFQTYRYRFALLFFPIIVN